MYLIYKAYKFKQIKFVFFSKVLTQNIRQNIIPDVIYKITYSVTADLGIYPGNRFNFSNNKTIQSTHKKYSLSYFTRVSASKLFQRSSHY